MSLIDEALRRAQSARRPGEESSPSSPDPWAAAPLPDRRRGPRRLVPAAIMILAVLAAAAGFALFRRSRESRPDSPRIRVAAVRPARTLPPPPPAAPPESAAAVSRPEPQKRRTPPPASAPARASVSPTAAVSASVSSLRTDFGESASRPPTVASVAPRVRSEPIAHVRSASSSPRIPAPAAAAPVAAARPSAPAASERGRNAQVGEVAVPGGHIELGGIVYSETNPVALLNGHIVGVGAVIEGFTVVSIEETRVELKNEHRTLVLTLR